MILDQFRLEGKLALVTGCSRGIGKAMAEGLAEAGADIIGVSASLPQFGSNIGIAVEKLGRKFYPYRCDFADRDSVHTFLKQVLTDHPQIDILVNNAGTTHRAPSAQFPEAEWDRVMEVNLHAPFLIAREIGRSMLERGSGKIIFTASLMSFQGGYTIPGYTASKGGIGQLTMAIANEWAVRGVCVNAIAPGYIATELTEALRNDPVRSRQIMERIPAGRWGRPEDFKGPVVFLASSAADYLSGHILAVDGGWLGR